MFFAWRFGGLSFLICMFLPQLLLADEIPVKSFQEKFFQPRNETLGVEVVAVADPEQIKPGEKFQLRLRMTIPEGWHIYSLKLEGEDAALATAIRFEENIFPILGKWEETEPRMEMDEVLQKATKSHSRYAEFNVQQKIPKNTKPGTYPLAGTVVYHACDNKICTLPKELPFKTQVNVTARGER
jgi:DsbC/DsbD-like thiol-disulfide interchange protein